MHSKPDAKREVIAMNPTRAVLEGLCPMGRTHVGARAKREEQQRRAGTDGPQPSAPLGERGLEEWGTMERS